MTTKAQLLATIADLQSQVEAIQEASPDKHKYEPSGGGWFVTPVGTIVEIISREEYTKFGVEFQTEQQAIQSRNEMYAQNIIRKYVLDFGDGWEADWNDEEQRKHYIYYSHSCSSSRYQSVFTFNAQNTGQAYMSYECAERLCDNLNAGRVSLKFTELEFITEGDPYGF